MSLRFFQEFLKSPGSVGAIWPSSPALAALMVSAAQLDSAERVLELGPGSGAFTGLILAGLRPAARFLAVEKNPLLAETLAAKYPGCRVLAGCATRLSEHLQEENFGAPDVILSGLPWAAFPSELQETILSGIGKVLGRNGRFLTFAYYGPHRLRAGRSFRQRLDFLFEEVTRTRVVLANVPPAFVYHCSRVRPGT